MGLGFNLLFGKYIRKYSEKRFKKFNGNLKRCYIWYRRPDLNRHAIASIGF